MEIVSKWSYPFACAAYWSWPCLSWSANYRMTTETHDRIAVMKNNTISEFISCWRVRLRNDYFTIGLEIKHTEKLSLDPIIFLSLVERFLLQCFNDDETTLCVHRIWTVLYYFVFRFNVPFYLGYWIPS